MRLGIQLALKILLLINNASATTTSTFSASHTSMKTPKNETTKPAETTPQPALDCASIESFKARLENVEKLLSELSDSSPQLSEKLRSNEKIIEDLKLQQNQTLKDIDDQKNENIKIRDNLARKLNNQRKESTKNLKDLERKLNNQTDGKINSSERKIMNEVNSKASSAENNINAVKSRMSSAESNINSVKSRVSSAESNINSVKYRVSSSESSIRSVKRRVSSAENSIYYAKRDIRSVKSKVSSAESRINSVKSRVSSAENSIYYAKRDIRSAKSTADGLKNALVAGKVYKSCPRGWHGNGNKCYLLLEAQVTMRVERETECKDRHPFATLARIESDYERRYLYRITSSSAYWIDGGDRNSEGRYKYGNGNSVSRYLWARGQPDNYRNEDCLVFWGRHGKLNDIRCRNNHHRPDSLKAICQLVLYR